MHRASFTEAVSFGRAERRSGTQRGGDCDRDLFSGLGIDENYVRTDISGSHFLMTDVLNSTIGLTDGTGNIATRYSYEPFGLLALSGTASSNNDAFTGREDDGTGLQYLRARYYNPVLGKPSNSPEKQMQCLLRAVDNSEVSIYLDALGFIPVARTGSALFQIGVGAASTINSTDLLGVLAGTAGVKIAALNLVEDESLLFAKAIPGIGTFINVEITAKDLWKLGSEIWSCGGN